MVATFKFFLVLAINTEFWIRFDLWSYTWPHSGRISIPMQFVDTSTPQQHANEHSSVLGMNHILSIFLFNKRQRARKKLPTDATYNISSLKIYCVHFVLYYIYAIWNIHHSENLNDLRNFEYKDFQKIDQNNIYKMSFIMPFTICTSQYALHSTHFLYALPYALQSMHFTVCTLH